MQDFSLDNKSGNIHNTLTRQYFKEILESYHNGNYRSTIVMLYTVVICDLIYKLKELDEIYNDKKAKQILKEIAVFQDKNPKSPTWETELVKMISERLTLFDISTFENIKSLQQHRHISAHPVLKKDYILYSPNKETTRAHLRNMLEDVLTKPPLISKEIFKEIVIDLEKKKDYFPPQFNNSQFERYLVTKYLKNSPEETIIYVFRNLWKFTFKLTDKNAKANRDINYSALHVIYKKYKTTIRTNFENDKTIYSNITEGIPCQFLISFLSIHPELYELLDEHAKIMINQEHEINIDSKIRAWYTFKSLEDYYDALITSYENQELNFDERNLSNFKSLTNLIRDTEDHLQHELIIKFIAHLYANSSSYNEADLRFKLLISDNLHHFNKTTLVYILEQIEMNEQVFLRGAARKDHSKINDFILEKFADEIDVSKYENFANSIKERLKSEIEINEDDLPF